MSEYAKSCLFEQGVSFPFLDTRCPNNWLVMNKQNILVFLNTRRSFPRNARVELDSFKRGK